MQEEWRIVPEFPFCEVSNLGQVRRNGKLVNPCNSRGYRVVSINQRPRYVHALVASAFLGERPVDPKGNKYEVNHKDLNRANNRLDNLEYVTASQNIIHSQKSRKNTT